MIQSPVRITGSRLVRCNGFRCPVPSGHVLGEWIGPDTFLRKAGGDAIVSGAVRISIKCDRCNHVNKVR